MDLLPLRILYLTPTENNDRVARQAFERWRGSSGQVTRRRSSRKVNHCTSLRRGNPPDQ